MSDLADKIFSGLLLVFAIAVGVFAWTQGVTTKIESINSNKQLEDKAQVHGEKVEELLHRMESIESKIASISDLSIGEKEALDVKLQVVDIKDQYSQVIALMKIVQDDPSKVFEFKDVKLKQETDAKILEERIISLDKVLNTQLSSLSSQIETARFYNNILIGIVIIMLGITWRQTRVQHTYEKQNQAGA